MFVSLSNGLAGPGRAAVPMQAPTTSLNICWSRSKGLIDLTGAAISGKSGG